jgi:Pyruvate kinase, barrel domain
MLPELLTVPHPLPLALQVSDIAIAVREGTDAVMLSGESAYGQFPYKAVDVMCTVAKHTEASMLSYAVGGFEELTCCSVCCIGSLPAACLGDSAAAASATLYLHLIAC